MNERAVIGDNKPPDMTEVALDTMRSISDWMKDHPVIDKEDVAREAKVYLDRGKLCIKDLEDERDKKVRPLNEQVKEINDYYREPRDRLKRVLAEIDHRISSFLYEEERKRQEAAREAARIAEEAERIARQREADEQAALRSADSGVLDVDIATAVVEADAAFDAYKKASRFAERAEKETKVKLGGGFGRAVSLKTVERLVITDAVAALTAIGLTDDIRDAILKGARAYRKVWDEIPPGIDVEIERKL